MKTYSDKLVEIQIAKSNAMLALQLGLFGKTYEESWKNFGKHMNTVVNPMIDKKLKEK